VTAATGRQASSTLDPVVICGGGPAGMMCGYLLARAGVPVTVLEKHQDFLRDFRGDTIHPSTLELLHELGILEPFLARPHQEVRYAEGELGDTRVRLADFTHLPTHCKFVAFMPQWDFLNFLADQARALPAFTLRMETEALRVVLNADHVTGVEVQSASGEERLNARLVIAADGRESVLRNSMRLAVEDLGAPMDVLWFKLRFREGDAPAVLGRIAQGAVLVRLFRGDYWQCALIIRKDTFDTVQREGLGAFRRRVAFLAHRDNADEIESWDDVRLLTVKVDRLRQWAAPGILFIGDAAHAMSPIGGVGINLAIQDAVATANLLAGPLRLRAPTLDELRRVQRRRSFPTRATQALQLFIQDRAIDPLLASGSAPSSVPWIVALAQRFPVLQRIPALVIGVGFRPEHVRSSPSSTIR
jgi:2-polyprenyl-6-methoxyphenol hydroxylase-like FAD-dependent oxidoreductase